MAFLAIQRLALQRRVDLGEGHGRHVGAQAVEHVYEHRILDCAQRQALDVFQPIHRAPAVGDVAEAHLPVAQANEAAVAELVQLLRADGAVEHRVGLALIAGQERQVEQRELLEVSRDRKSVV